MKVTVRPYLFLRDALGKKEIILDLVEGSTVYDLLEALRREYGLTDRIESGRHILQLLEGGEPVGLIILIDGGNIRQKQGTATKLHDGAVVSLFPPAAGG